MAPESGIGPHRVVVLGGGFGGLNAAKALGRAPVEVVLVDRRNYHLFQPLLYQVATGGLSPADIAAPLRHVLARRRNVGVLLGEAVDFDVGRRELVLEGSRLRYDTLVVATGAEPSYFGHPEWAPGAPGLKSIEDATRIRARVLTAFERAERAESEDERAALLTFAIVGGGATGVELAGALAELRRDTLAGNFRRFDPRSARILLVEAGERILSTYPSELSAKAQRSLERLGVDVLTGAMVVGVEDGSLRLERGGRRDELRAFTILWAAGVHASPLGRRLAERTGAATDRQGRIFVERDLSLPGHPEIFVIGDLAQVEERPGEPLPAVAPVAMQAGRFVGREIGRRLAGEAPRAFHYRDRGNLATIGRAAAVAELGRLRFSGFPAWVLWLLVHLMYLVGFANRVLVLFQWAWCYFTHNRTARLITEQDEASAPRAGKR
jgi:NADH dehydrogenase